MLLGLESASKPRAVVAHVRRLLPMLVPHTDCTPKPVVPLATESLASRVPLSWTWSSCTELPAAEATRAYVSLPISKASTSIGRWMVWANSYLAAVVSPGEMVPLSWTWISWTALWPFAATMAYVSLPNTSPSTSIEPVRVHT